jgi:RND family efflux transporter MFP subunit
LRLLVALFGLLLFSSCQNAEGIAPPVSERPHLSVQTERLVPTTSGTTTLTYSGTLRAARNTQVGFLRSGRIETLYVDDGSRVTSGQLLGLLDIRSLLAQQRELQAQLVVTRAALAEVQAGPRRYERGAATDQIKQIESQLALVRTKLKRRRALFKNGAVPKEQVDELVSQEQNLINQLRASHNRVKDLDAGARTETINAARARVAQVQASLASLQVPLADSELRAPYAGTVGRRLLDEGAIVSTGQPVFELLTARLLEATVSLPPDRAERLSVGEQVTISAEKQPYTARVKEILPQVDTTTGTQPVLLSVPAGPGLVTGGLIVLQLQGVEEREGYWVPVTALLPGERGLFMLYTINPVEGESDLYAVKKQAVELLQTTGSKAFVRGTLVGQPEAIIEGVQRVVPGQKVRKQG